MASGRFFDPLVALRIVPLISSTATLVFAHDETLFLGVFARPEHREQSREIIPPYFTTFFFKGGVHTVLFLLTLTTGSSIANLYNQRAKLHARESFWWYIAGATLSTAHLLFGPLVMPSCQKLFDNAPGTEANEALDEWLSINFARTVTVDLAAWVATGIAVLKTLTA